jgi:hypothetical protein
MLVIRTESEWNLNHLPLRRAMEWNRIAPVDAGGACSAMPPAQRRSSSLCCHTACSFFSPPIPGKEEEEEEAMLNAGGRPAGEAHEFKK